MAILVDEMTRVLVQGITGREGRFHALRNRAYGTQVVAGVTPGKGGGDVEGIPVFDTVQQAAAETGADTSLVFVPSAHAADAVFEAVDAGLRLIVAVTEGIPVKKALQLHHWAREQGAVLIGPNGPGIISPGKATVGIMPTEGFREGEVGIVSRSGTLTYEVALELTSRGLGQSTAVGIGGDAVPGSSFVDMLELFERDDRTKAVVVVGEIGGHDEEQAAAYAQAHLSKPIVAFIVGYSAPQGRQMGHAGAIAKGGSETAGAKRAVLEAAGIPVAADAMEVADLVGNLLQ